MTYIKRAMENTFLRLSKEYPALLLTGPRQAGKTTMLQKLAQDENVGREYVTLDDLAGRVGLLPMSPMSQAEICGVPTMPFVLNLEALTK